MLAGVGGIDAVLLVVAADESVMPQTREHFAICRLLQHSARRHRADQGGPGRRRHAGAGARSRRASWSPARCSPTRRSSPVSARTGAGLDALRAALGATRRRRRRSRATRRRAAAADRSRLLDAGFGTVVTGTLTRGDAARGRRAGRAAGRCAASRCAACRCTARRSRRASRDAASPSTSAASTSTTSTRGDTLTPRRRFRGDAALRRDRSSCCPDAKPLRHGTRVRVPPRARRSCSARVVAGAPAASWAPGCSRRARALRLEAPAVLTRGDRFVLRAVLAADHDWRRARARSAAGALADPDRRGAPRDSRGWPSATTRRGDGVRRRAAAAPGCRSRAHRAAAGIDAGAPRRACGASCRRRTCRAVGDELFSAARASRALETRAARRRSTSIIARSRCRRACRARKRASACSAVAAPALFDAVVQRLAAQEAARRPRSAGAAGTRACR